jgi:hypothetical protein
MPSTYSTNLRFELIAPGEQTGTWGGTTNTNIGTLIEQAISGASSVVMSDANLTLSANNGATDQARSMYLAVTSSVPLTTTRNVVCPAVPKMYVVRNATTGGQQINVTAGGTGVLIPNGVTATVICDGTDVRVAASYLLATAGAVATPSVTFAGSASTGLYSPASNVVGVTINGVERVRADATGLMVGATTSAGDVTNNLPAIAGRFTTVSGSTVLTSGVAGTLITLPTNLPNAVYLACAGIDAVDVANYSLVVLFILQRTSARRVQLATSSLLTLFSSGFIPFNQFDVTQSSGAPATVNWTVTRIQ